MVGTDTGNTYRNKMGDGFAVINPYDPKYDLALKQERDRIAAQKKEAKQKRLDNAYEQLGKIKPDNWYVHDGQMKTMMNGLVDFGASLIQKGEDPYQNPDFNKLLIENTRMSEYSKQYQKNFEDIQKAYKNGEELENWDQVAEYATNPDLIGMVNGDYGKAPKPIFKKPEISVFKATNEVWKIWDENNKGQIPTPDDAGVIADKLVKDPTYSGGFASTGSKQKQMYDSLPKAQREAYEAAGAANGRDGYTQFVADDLYAAKNPYFNMEEDILSAADLVNTSEWEVENDAVTKKGTSIKQSEKELREIVRGRLKPGAVFREAKQGKYGDPNKDISFNIKAAEDYYYPKFKKNIATKFSRTEDEAGKEGKKTEASFANWYNDITSGDGDKFIAAAPYLDKEALARFVPDMPKDARIGNIKYYRSGRMEIVLVDENGDRLTEGEGKKEKDAGSRFLEIGDIPKEMLKNAYMDQYKGTKRNYETTETGQQQGFSIKQPTAASTGFSIHNK